MELWNDFEGKVVDDRYRLGRLLAPKGRSAFFASTGPRGEALSLRLIESLNDEDEILARWRQVVELREEHLVRMLACGQTMLDGTHLVYAALEATDAELSEVLRERPLTVDETRAMAAAVLAGLEALHGAGLVHEHVEAASVLGQGEVIKLRSDCVREAPAGALGETLRRRDTHDFAMLVGYALTQRRDAMQGMVPRQFEDLVRNGMSGTWGLKEMAALLRPAAPIAPAAGAGANANGGAGSGVKRPNGAAPVPSAASVLATAVNGGIGHGAEVGGGRRVPGSAAAGPMLVGPRGAGAAAGATAGASGGVSLAAVAAPERMGAGVASTSLASAAAAMPQRPSGAASGAVVGLPAAGLAGDGPKVRIYSPSAVASALGGSEEAETLPTRRAEAADRGQFEDDQKRRLLIPLGVLGVILLLMLVIWTFVRGRAARPAPVQPQTSSVPAPVVVPAKPSAASAARPASAAAQRFARAHTTVETAPLTSGAAAPATVGAGAPGVMWRVVAYTYARQDQAQGKANQLAAGHPELKPEVFSPSGRSPFLVTVGGWLSAAQAQTERERARRDGLPRDTYAQNYRGR